MHAKIHVQSNKWRYTVQVINAGNSSGYVIKKWDINARFSNVSDLKDHFASDFATLLPISNLGTFTMAVV